MLDSYLCPKCKGLVPEISNTALSSCVNCGEKYSLKPFRKINEEAQKYLDSKYEFNVFNIENSLIRLSKTHLKKKYEASGLEIEF